MPTTLSVNFEEAHIIYTTKPASSRLDHFTHITKCKAENFKVILAPSPKYTGLSDEPPRYMGEGFVVFQSNFVDLYYYQDEAGIYSLKLISFQLFNCSFCSYSVLIDQLPKTRNKLEAADSNY